MDPTPPSHSAEPDRPPEPDSPPSHEVIHQLLRAGFLRVAASPPRDEVEPPVAGLRAVIETTLGQMEISLLPAEAPRTTANFVHLCRSRYYDHLAIERSHPNAYISVGGHRRSDGAAYVLPAERPERARTAIRGSLWMATDLDGCRFTICRSPWKDLDETGAVLGQVRSGWEVLDQLRTCDSIVSIRILTAPPGGEQVNETSDTPPGSGGKDGGPRRGQGPARRKD